MCFDFLILLILKFWQDYFLLWFISYTFLYIEVNSRLLALFLSDHEKDNTVTIMKPHCF